MPNMHCHSNIRNVGQQTKHLKVCRISNIVNRIAGDRNLTNDIFCIDGFSDFTKKQFIKYTNGSLIKNTISNCLVTTYYVYCVLGRFFPLANT